MTDADEQRGLYERLKELEKDIAWLEGHSDGDNNIEQLEHVRRLRENIDVLLGEGDLWSDKK